MASELRQLDLTSITETSVRKSLQSACRLAGVKAFNPHCRRHLFAVSEYRQDKDIYRLQKLLNHSSISITEAYLKTMGEL
jgi:site-specific recombinase XerD